MIRSELSSGSFARPRLKALEGNGHPSARDEAGDGARLDASRTAAGAIPRNWSRTGW